MIDLWPFTHPQFPDNAGGWADVFVLFFISVFLYRKAWLMAQRSTRVDGLGLALILSNTVLATAYMVGVWYQLWPALLTVDWFRRGVRGVVLIFVAFAWLQMERSSPDRVRRVSDDSAVARP